MAKYVNFGSVVNMGRNSVSVNGININVPSGSSVTSVNGKIFIDGKEYISDDLKNKEIVSIIINGDIDSLISDVDVTVKGSATTVKANRDVEVGSVDGSISAGRDVDVSGSVTGTISAGRDVDVSGKHFK